MSIVIELYQSRTRTNPNGTRPQRWRWRAKNTGNHKKLAQSTEAYTNRNDCLNAIHALFGADVDIQLPTGQP